LFFLVLFFLFPVLFFLVAFLTLFAIPKKNADIYLLDDHNNDDYETSHSRAVLIFLSSSPSVIRR
jgi:hypothetical protein